MMVGCVRGGMGRGTGESFSSAAAERLVALPSRRVQETIAKLNNNDGVKQQLWGLRNLPAPVQPGDEVGQ